jgi:hypothetical protein
VLYTEIEDCRICGNPQLDLILDLGKLSLTGIFPRSKSEEVPTGPLNLIKCNEENSKKDIPYIGEVNADKFGCYTPGTLIPIISEEEAREMNPDYFFIFPWHFKEFIFEKEKNKRNKKTALLFPLPSIETFR